MLKNHGNQPRYRQNRLLFLAADADAVSRLRDAVRSSLAWRSILDDVGNGKLNIDRVQKEQAKKEAKAVDDAMPRTARECYKWLLCLGSTDPGLKEANIEAFQVNTAGDELVTELGRICTDNELVISRWSAMHLRTLLKQYYWKEDKPSVGAQTVWQDTLKFLYLPRLRSHTVFEQAIQQGVASDDFFGTALGEREGRYEGFQLAVPHVQIDGQPAPCGTRRSEALPQFLDTRACGARHGTNPARVGRVAASRSECVSTGRAPCRLRGGNGTRPRCWRQSKNEVVPRRGGGERGHGQSEAHADRGGGHQRANQRSAGEGDGESGSERGVLERGGKTSALGHEIKCGATKAVFDRTQF